MSYILDALKKSERERGGPRAGEPADDGGAINVRSPWPLALALVVASNALLGLGWWAWQRAADKGDDQRSAHTEASATSAPADMPSAIPPAPSTPAPLAAPALPAPATKAAVGDLAAEARRPPTPARTQAPARARPAATLSPPDDAGTQPVAAHPAAASVPWLRELPSAFRTAVAPLKVNIHVFAGTSEDSVLYINDRQYRAGETLPNGVRLDAVVADGAVLSYQGRQFKLPRPN